MYIYLDIQMYLYVCIDDHLKQVACICKYMYMCIYIYMYIYLHIQMYMDVCIDDHLK